MYSVFLRHLRLLWNAENHGVDEKVIDQAVLDVGMCRDEQPVDEGPDGRVLLVARAACSTCSLCFFLMASNFTRFRIFGMFTSGSFSI